LAPDLILIKDVIQRDTMKRKNRGSEGTRTIILEEMNNKERER
jgi:hypothetical protein